MRNECYRCRREVWFMDVYCSTCKPVVEEEQARSEALDAETALLSEDGAMLWPRIVRKGAHRGYSAKDGR